MSDTQTSDAERQQAMNDAAVHARTLARRRNQRPRIARMENHPYVQRVEDVSFSDDRELLEVSFSHAVPEVFVSRNEISVVGGWLDTLPGLWGTLLGDGRARKLGLGSTCITLLVEIQDPAPREDDTQ